MFWTQVVERIDEDIFTDLFNQNMGAPNASVKLLVGMMILKEAFGWSDNELYENCRFNLLLRSALGLFNIHDSIPVESTYYLFRKRIHDYHKEKQVDLMEQVFKHITNRQALEFGVTGKNIRMDSKLIGSNIIFSARYELVHNTLASFYKEMIKVKPVKLAGHDLKALQLLAETSGNKIVYVSGREEVKKRLQGLGILCYKVLSVYQEKDIDRCYLRKQIEQLPDKIRNKRNNVEATIFHLTHYIRNDKTKYRGISRNKLWAMLRSLWINLKRIINWMGKLCPKTPNISQLPAQKAGFDQKMTILKLFIQILGLNRSEAEI
jgi:hypothetical protein